MRGQAIQLHHPVLEFLTVLETSLEEKNLLDGSQSCHVVILVNYPNVVSCSLLRWVAKRQHLDAVAQVASLLRKLLV